MLLNKSGRKYYSFYFSIHLVSFLWTYIRFIKRYSFVGSGLVFLFFSNSFWRKKKIIGFLKRTFNLNVIGQFSHEGIGFKTIFNLKLHKNILVHSPWELFSIFCFPRGCWGTNQVVSSIFFTFQFILSVSFESMLLAFKCKVSLLLILCFCLQYFF